MSCICNDLPGLKIIKTTHEDDAITFASIQAVEGRCLLCGRQINIELIPSDYSIGGQGPTISERSSNITLPIPGSPSDLIAQAERQNNLPEHFGDDVLDPLGET